MNNLHPTLEELLDKYNNKKEVSKTNEELNNKSFVRKFLSFFKKSTSKRRRKLRKKRLIF